MAEIRIRLNLDKEEVELVVDNQVVATVEKHVVHSWVEAINEKNKPAHEEPIKVDAPVEDEPVKVDAPVEEPAPEEEKIELPEQLDNSEQV
jgi:hypothetical protein